MRPAFLAIRPCRYYHFAFLLLGVLALLTTACHKQSPAEQLEEANRMYQEQDILNAQMKYETLLKDHPESGEAKQAYIGLGMCYMADKNFEKAREQFSAAVQAFGGPQTPEGFNADSMRLASYVQEQKPAEALKEALKTSDALKTAPPEAREVMMQQMIDLYRANKQDDAATTLITKLLAVPPSDMRRHMPLLEKLGTIYASRKEFAKASQAYTDYLALYPETPLRGIVLFGQAYYLKQGNDVAGTETALTQAEAQFKSDFDKAISADQKVQALVQLARVQQFRGNHDQARATLQQLLDRDKYPLAQHRQTGQMALTNIELEANQPEAAIKVLEQIAQENPNSEIAANAQRMMEQVRTQFMARRTTGTLQTTTGTLPTTATVSMQAATTATATSVTAAPAAANAPTAGTAAP